VTTPISNSIVPRAEELGQLFERAGTAQSYPRGVSLFVQGETPQGVFAISAGLVKLASAFPDGRMAISGIRSPGWLLGGSAALLSEPFAVTATTVTSCRIYRLPAPDFRRLVQTDPEFSSYVHAIHAQEVLRGLHRLARLTCFPARERFEELLAELAEELPHDEGRIEIPLRDWEIAQLVAVTPPYLSRIVQQLMREGRLRREQGALVLVGVGP